MSIQAVQISHINIVNNIHAVQNLHTSVTNNIHTVHISPTKVTNNIEVVDITHTNIMTRSRISPQLSLEYHDQHTAYSSDTKITSTRLTALTQT